MKKTYSLTLSEIPDFAKQLAQQLRGGEILALIGGLGSGKTAFVKALGNHLKVKDKITSPTFVLMNIFPAILPTGRKKVSLLHLDLYRTKSLREINALGLEELWHRHNYVTVIEWANKLKGYLPKNARILKFFHE